MNARSGALVVASLSCFAVSAVCAEEPSAAPPRDGVRWYAVPNVGFDSDDGWGYGARAELADDEPGFDPYQSAYVLHAFFTSRGFQHHRIRWDRTGLLENRSLRLTTHLAWRQWLNDGYFGQGNRTLRERAYVGSFADGDPRRKRYRYTLYQPFWHTTARLELAGPWEAFGAINAKWSEVQTYAGSLLDEERPYGMDGGLTVQGFAGVLYDTRAPEVTPTSGVLLELSFRWAPALPEGAGVFGGVLASARGYRALGPRVVAAARIMTEFLVGTLPFYELVHWGGNWPIPGFGGAETLRGISFGRWRAPGKAITNVELRWSVGEGKLGDERFVAMLVPYVDAGVVYGKTEPSALPAGGPIVHPAAGMSFRAEYAEAFVGRIDLGAGLDPIAEPDGTVTLAYTPGIYVVFDHPF